MEVGAVGLKSEGNQELSLSLHCVPIIINMS